MNSSEKTILEYIAETSKNLVWWKPEQRARGEDLINDPTKGERPWTIPEKTGVLLYETVIASRSSSILELGTSIGYSTIWMAYALKNTNGHIHTIEQSLNKIPIARANFELAGVRDSVTLHEGAIIDVLKSLPDEIMFDGVFLDADRGHYHEYFPLIEPRLKPGSWVIADNAGNMSKRMAPFFELLTERGWEYEILDMDNGILVARKKTL